MRRLLPAPKFRPPPVRRQEVTIVADAAAAAQADVDAMQAVPVVTLATDATLSNERVLTAGAGTTITDAGAGSTVTIAATSSGGGNGVEATVDFGSSFTEYATVVVTGQAWVTGTSKIVVTPSTTAANAQDYLLHDFRFTISDLVVGTGFTLHVHAGVEAKGTYTFNCIGV